MKCIMRINMPTYPSSGIDDQFRKMQQIVTNVIVEFNAHKAAGNHIEVDRNDDMSNKRILLSMCSTDMSDYSVDFKIVAVMLPSDRYCWYVDDSPMNVDVLTNLHRWISQTFQCFHNTFYEIARNSKSFSDQRILVVCIPQKCVILITPFYTRSTNEDENQMVIRFATLTSFEKPVAGHVRWAHPTAARPDKDLLVINDYSGFLQALTLQRHLLRFDSAFTPDIWPVIHRLATLMEHFAM